MGNHVDPMMVLSVFLIHADTASIMCSWIKHSEDTPHNTLLNFILKIDHCFNVRDITKEFEI